MIIYASVNVSPEFMRYIQSDVYHRMNKKLSQPETITDNIAACANEDVSLAVKNFIKAPDKGACVYKFIHQQSRAALPEELRNATTAFEYRKLFKSVLGMLATKADDFTSSEKACYQKLCKHFSSEIKKEPNKFKGNAYTRQDIIDKDDKQFWLKAAPLLQTYSKDILGDLTAHMLNQSINAWCEYHNVTDRNHARDHVEQVFSNSIRLPLDMLDNSVADITKTAKLAIKDKQLFYGTKIRINYMQIFDAVAAIPFTLRRQVSVGAAKPSTVEKLEKAVGTSDSEVSANGHYSPKASSSPRNITVYGSNTTVTPHGGNTPTTPLDPWSSIAEKLLNSDKIDNNQRFLLLKDLIATIGERRETPPNFFNHSPLLSGLNSISTQDLPGYSTLPHGNTKSFSMETGNIEPTAPMIKREQEHFIQVKRRTSSSHSVGSGVSATTSPERSPLDNFQIDTLLRKRNINPLASQDMYRTVGADLSAAVAEKRYAANDYFPMTEVTSRFDLSSPAGRSSSGINKEDFALLKRWLSGEVEKNKIEDMNKINSLNLKEDNTRYSDTIEGFLEVSFLASAGTENLSDTRQTYIKESFRKMLLHKDFSKLSLNAKELVKTYAHRDKALVFTTAPGVRRSLSPQTSVG